MFFSANGQRRVRRAAFFNILKDMIAEPMPQFAKLLSPTWLVGANFRDGQLGIDLRFQLWPDFLTMRRMGEIGFPGFSWRSLLLRHTLI